MTVGLGTGSTVAFLLPALAARGLSCAASPPRRRPRVPPASSVSRSSRSTALDRLDIAVDGADQIAPDRWIVKGGGAAHTREKIVAAAAERYVVIASPDKLVDAIRAPIPLELLPFGLRRDPPRAPPPRDPSATPVPQPRTVRVIADYHGPVDDPADLAARLTPRSRAWSSTASFRRSSSPTSSSAAAGERRARSSRAARSRLKAALISARWVNACGKLPSCSPVGPISSA